MVFHVHCLISLEVAWCQLTTQTLLLFFPAFLFLSQLFGFWVFPCLAAARLWVAGSIHRIHRYRPCQAPSNSCRSDSGSCLKSSIVKPLPWAPTHQQSLPVQWLNISEYNDRMIDIDWWWLDSKVCRVLSYQVISSLRSSWTACAAAFGLSFSLWRFVKALRARFIKIFKVVSSV